jgi:hypothetical protein
MPCHVHRLEQSFKVPKSTLAYCISYEKWFNTQWIWGVLGSSLLSKYATMLETRLHVLNLGKNWTALHAFIGKKTGQ